MVIIGIFRNDKLKIHLRHRGLGHMSERISNSERTKPTFLRTFLFILIDSMAYGTRKLNVVLTRAL